MKKVLFAIVSLINGGAERVVSVWSKELKEQGYDVSILVCTRFENEYKIAEGIKIYSVAPEGKKFWDLSLIKRYRNFRKILKEISPDVVINFLPKMQIWMNFATMCRKVRKIETIRNSPWDMAFSSKLSKLLWKRTFKKADAVIVQTQEQAEFFNKKIQKKCSVVYNPVAKQYKENPKTEYKKAINFVGAGRLCEQKNFPLMIKAFKLALDKNPELKLFIYGTGKEDYIEKLNSIIKENNLEQSVKLMGRTGDMANVLKNADAFLMSSNFEGMPNALIEAMCVGLPCVSTDCRTGPKDLIDNGENGCLVSVRDESAFANAILSVANMLPEQAKEMGEKAREKILDVCGEEKSLGQLIKVIEG